MKRLNNKGFAISTVVYGLCIMGILIVMIVMRSMAANRTNQKAISESIENELNRLSKTEIRLQAVPSELSGGSLSKIVIPDSGWYKIELWGAQGGNGTGGLGAYTSGIIHLNSGDVLYYHKGMMTPDGGESTDIRLVDGGYDELNSYETRIMVAAGGGKEASANGGTTKEYKVGRNSTGTSIALSSGKYSLVSGQTLLGKTSGSIIDIQETEYLANSSPKGTNGGGDGYIHSNQAATGGISYISGYGGRTVNFKTNNLVDKPFTYYKKNFSNDTGTWSYEGTGKEYVFVDGIMKPGVQMGDGDGNIVLVQATPDEDTALNRLNNVLDNKQYIMVCKDSAGSNFANSGWNHRLVVSYGKNKDDGKKETYTDTKVFSDGTKVDGRCKRYDLTQSYNINQITLMWTENEDARYSIKVSNSKTPSTFQSVRSSTDGINETMTASGITVSAYQPNLVSDLSETETYIIQPITQESKVMAFDGTNVVFDYLTNNSFKTWRITKNGTEYIITNSSNNENNYLGTDGNKAIVGATPTKWTIQHIGDGTYTLSTGGKILQPYSTNNVFNLVAPANTSTNIARFKIYMYKGYN